MIVRAGEGEGGREVKREVVGWFTEYSDTK
jgi:hypothetical protein